MNKKYKIEKIGDLLDMPMDVLRKFCDEVSDIIIPAKEQFDLLKILGEKGKGSEVMPSITYIDDNKRDVEITLDVKVD